jgi:AraC-like DNA-binding protein
MKLDFNMDIAENSITLANTPSLASQLLPFHVFVMGHFYAGSNYYTVREGLDNYLMIFTISGEGYLKYLDKEYIIKPGQVFLINCMEPHTYKTGSKGAWELKYVHFNGFACPNYYKLINDDGLNIITLSDLSKLLMDLKEIMEFIRNGHLHSDIQFSMVMTNILTELYMNKLNPLDNIKYDEHRRMIDNVVAYLQKNHTEKISVKELLGIAHLSEFHFLRLFKKYTGVGPYEYLINYRINKSKDLLRGTGLSVEDIAYKVGFRNVNNYIRDFKKVAGTTPLKFRNFWIT